mgnify:CR=1 FL=1
MSQSTLTYCLIIKYDCSILGMGRTVLVVEDDVDLIGIYKEILELHEFEVDTAANGEEGVKKFIEIKPSLVIMDGECPFLTDIKHSSR